MAGVSRLSPSTCGESGVAYPGCFSGGIFPGWISRGNWMAGLCVARPAEALWRRRKQCHPGDYLVSVAFSSAELSDPVANGRMVSLQYLSVCHFINPGLQQYGRQHPVGGSVPHREQCIRLDRAYFLGGRRELRPSPIYHSGNFGMDSSDRGHRIVWSKTSSPRKSRSKLAAARPALSRNHLRGSRLKARRDDTFPAGASPDNVAKPSAWNAMISSEIPVFRRFSPSGIVRHPPLPLGL